ncbi:hypothetical protein C0581_05265 [Candidatus Parcubacteria bacterium]|nr:MAG: hypothetical protein C0581_05265 [Candidatus Parcubacteria bacterium]
MLQDDIPRDRAWLLDVGVLLGPEVPLDAVLREKLLAAKEAVDGFRVEVIERVAVDGDLISVDIDVGSHLIVIGEVRYIEDGIVYLLLRGPTILELTILDEDQINVINVAHQNFRYGEHVERRLHVADQTMILTLLDRALVADTLIVRRRHVAAETDECEDHTKHSHHKNLPASGLKLTYHDNI